jgi:hypothetical protein
MFSPEPFFEIAVGLQALSAFDVNVAPLRIYFLLGKLCSARTTAFFGIFYLPNDVIDGSPFGFEFQDADDIVH